MAKTRRILITGGLGLIGHNVARMLLEQGHDVIVTDICTGYGLVPAAEINYLIEQRRQKLNDACAIYSVDIADEVGMAWLFRAHRPDTVIHLASFPRQKVVNANPMAGSHTMSQGLLNLLELSGQHDIDRFVYISSSMVYGDFEDQVREDAVCRPQGQYAIMKLAGEWLVKDYTRRGKFDHVIIRPSAVYGELDVEDRVVSRFMIAAHRDAVLRVHGDGEMLDFSYVEDVADGIASASLLPVARNKTYNITRGQARSLLEAAQLAVEIAGRGRVEILARDMSFPSRAALDISAARRDLGYCPQVDIEQGFRKYYDWLDHSIYWSKKTI
jgi:nucleoside-diphosphate-sugar epimerase